jgi:selenide,water dikinase
VRNEHVLLGLDRPDDAGIYRISEEVALVQTLDFFTPIVDDPRTFGRIAAANSLSDVYAKGGRPITALNVVCFPSKVFPPEVLREILEGGLSVLHEAECVLLGGHSVDDPELKYGLSVTGVVHPKRFLANAGAQPGDAAVLTKPIGTGVVTTADKRRSASESALNAAVRSMLTLNRRASEAMLRHGAHAATDVTGFSLLGHSFEMIEKTPIDLEIHADSVPLLPEALALSDAGMLCGGLGRNRSQYGGYVSIDERVPKALADLLFDPQTSGGLLVALPGDRAGDFLAELGEGAARIGSFVPGSGRIRVTP